ncbi:hypothetical protein SCLCIDRAFT_29288 [Scleroderma citrinum Foug A]|uniref:Piwi domain-containing protein n=1 Tax=Scleroderma citrinum Foug A TaxID=1036808 RepID=A0A0C2Z4I0_9AGAM|nr:hypothetical protein SCLCIDRAFT_29288 [Scleroderma citrinum Foug A]
MLDIWQGVSPPQAFLMGTGSQTVTQDLQEAGTKTPKRPDLLLVVLPSSAADIRFAVKQFGDVFHGVPTQCVREDKTARANNQYCNNVAMKINAKLGDGTIHSTLQP